MGILYNSVTLQKNLKHEFVLERLKSMNVSKSQSGKPIELLDYTEAKYELVLASFRMIDAEKSESAWF